MSHGFLGAEGRPDPVLIRANGPMATYMWPDTGEEFDIIVDIIPQWMLNPDEKEVLLFAEWKDAEASSKELYALRKIFPNLSMQSVSEISREFSKSKRFSLGRFYESTAKELVESADKLGLKLLIVDNTEKL